MRQKKAKYFRREARNLENMMHNREEIREKLLTVNEWGDRYKALMNLSLIHISEPTRPY